MLVITTKTKINFLPLCMKLEFIFKGYGKLKLYIQYSTFIAISNTIQLSMLTYNFDAGS